MKKVFEECYCDVCGKSGANNYKVITLRTYDSTEGKCFYEEPKVYQESVDLCDYCAIRATNLYDKGVQCLDLEINRAINEPYFTKRKAKSGGQKND